MNKQSMKFNRNYLFLLLLLIVFLWFVSNIILYPKESVGAASKGLLTWFNIVVPSLLPFFITSEILIGLGFVDFIGTLLEPLMESVFNVPGKGAFPFTMSITSGYPVGVKLVSKLRKDNSITKIEAQRLVSFCSTSGPLFMIGAVSTGMLNKPSIGPLIVHSHYLGALTVGILFKYYKHEKKSKPKRLKNNYLKNAFNNLLCSRQKSNSSIGILISDSVKESVNSILLIGGFMVFYSVLIEILDITNFFSIVTKIISLIVPFNINTQIIKGILSGMIEITLGCKGISEATGISLLCKIVSISFLIGWSGFSIHSQAINFISHTDINSKLYILSKFLHGLFASIYSYVFFNLRYKNIVIPSFFQETNKWEILSLDNWISTFKSSIQLEFYIIISLLLSSLLIGIINNVSESK